MVLPIQPFVLGLQHKLLRHAALATIVSNRVLEGLPKLSKNGTEAGRIAQPSRQIRYKAQGIGQV